MAAAAIGAGEPVGGGSLRPASAPPPAPAAAGIFSAPLIELDGSISISPDGGEMTYRWRQLSGPPVELSDYASPKPRFRTNIPGIYEFELIVSAGGLDSEPHLVRLEIDRENLPPVAALAAEVLGQVGTVIEIDGARSTDPEGESLRYQWRMVTPGLDIPPEALTKPVLAFEPTIAGIFEVELVVSDGEKTSEPARTLVRVKPKPRPPVARAQIITVDAPAEIAVAPVALPGPAASAGAAPANAPERPAVPPVLPLPEMALPEAGTDAPAAAAPAGEVPPQLAGWTNSTARPLPAPPGAASLPPASPAAPPPEQDAGLQPSASVALAPIADLSPVSDLAPMTAPDLSYLPAESPAVPVLDFPASAVEPVSESLSAVVAPPPPLALLAGGSAAMPPVARIAAPGAAEAGKMFTLDARDSYSPSGSRLEYLWRQKSGPPVSDVEVVFDGAAERFMPTIPGEYEFELVVSDQGVLSEPVSHRVRITRPPDPPVAVVVAPTHALPGSLVRMDATRSYDANGGHLTYRWRQTGGPAVRDYVIDERVGDAAPAFRPEEPGLYSFSLVVWNGQTASNQVDLDIEVTEAVRRPPGLSIGGPDQARVGERLVFNAVATDATGWNLTYDWRQTEGPAQALSPSGGIRAMALAPAGGRYVFAVTAKDENGNEVASAEKTLEVQGGRAASGSGGAPYVSPPTPMRGNAEAGPRRVPELTPLPNTQTEPRTFPQPQTRGGQSGTRSAQVLRGSRGR